MGCHSLLRSIPITYLKVTLLFKLIVINYRLRGCILIFDGNNEKTLQKLE
jgi:hypothetical protein